MRSLYTLMISSLFFVYGCKTRAPLESDLAGVRAETLDGYGDQGPSPRYAALEQNGEVRLALFFTFADQWGRLNRWGRSHLSQSQDPDGDSSRWDLATRSLVEV